MKPYYEDAGIKIFCGDCREVLPGLEAMDAVITDPPYDAEAHTSMRRTRASIEGRADIVSMPFAPLTEDIRKQFVEASLGVCSGWVIAFCQAESVGLYQRLFGDAWRRAMIWVKPDAPPQFSGDRPAMGYESICCAWAGNGKSVWNGGGRRGVFNFNGTDFKHLHPTQKPIQLMADLVELFTNTGDSILDPFMGSGTTLVAAKELGRKAIGIEIEERYCEIAAKRLGQGILPLEFAQ